MKNHVGLPIKYNKEDHLHSNDLSHITEEDWEKLKKAYREKLIKNSLDKSQ